MVYDLDGKEYIDYPCALGAVILGYAHPYVTERVIKRIERGNLFSMPSIHETELADRITKLIPSMESMRFLKSGSEAVSAAVKIARAYTKRDIVLSNGYHGWHDWSTPITSSNLGTPSVLKNTIAEMNYNDLRDTSGLFGMLTGLFDKIGSNVACIVIDPYIFDKPDDSYFDGLIRIAHEHGALVIFDEVVTGIRWHKFAVQNSYKVKPDLTCLGKTLGNGIPISCVGGKRQIMDVLNNGCFVSSTFGGDLIGIEAALATLKVAQDENLPSRIKESGLELQEAYNEIASYMKVDTKCIGNPARQKLVFPTAVHKALFWQECLTRGVFLGAAQHTSLAHTDKIIGYTREIFKQAMNVVRVNWKDPKKVLRGKLPEEVSTISKLRN